MMKNNVRPVDIARRLQISTSSLRNYEKRGLVPPAERLPTGYRVYTEEHVAYFECIVAMSTGFGMDITTSVLKKIQIGDLDSALWDVNNAQVVNSGDRKKIKEAFEYLDKLLGEHQLKKNC
ncbi:MerR family DNA-binding transcriptional regulator [Alteribacter populi]|uniref:MerR family DNA-binding transcriptional regulator n=1 Tax=Alteribacter populi TaxID=2011011 RepID=UPI000BBAE2F9|nr:MerR family DNA-binding transcriptional regulator [Alteribacter populi]